MRPHENGVLAPPCDSGALSAGAIELLANPERAAAYGERGYQLVAQHDSIERFVGRSEALYHSLIKTELRKNRTTVPFCGMTDTRRRASEWRASVNNEQPAKYESSLVHLSKRKY